MPALLLSWALERHRVQGQGSEGEQSEHAVRACDCVSTLEQLPPGRKGSKWPGKQTPSVPSPRPHLLLVLQSAALTTSQRAGVRVCVWGGGRMIRDSIEGTILWAHRKVDATRIKRPGPRPRNAEGFPCVETAALVQTLALVSPCVPAWDPRPTTGSRKSGFPHSLASHLSSTESQQHSGRGRVFGPGTMSGWQVTLRPNGGKSLSPPVRWCSWPAIKADALKVPGVSMGEEEGGGGCGGCDRCCHPCRRGHCGRLSPWGLSLGGGKTFPI